MRDPLPDGVSFVGVVPHQTESGTKGVRSVSVIYAVAEEWDIILTADNPVSGQGFTQLEVRSKSSGAAAGLGPHLLRMVPFRHAKSCVDEALRSALVEGAPPIPKDYSEVVRYAQLAQAYAWFSKHFPDQPLKQMSKESEVERSTLSTRVSRAKALGYLAREWAGGPYVATEKAEQAISDAVHADEEPTNG